MGNGVTRYPVHRLPSMENVPVQGTNAPGAHCAPFERMRRNTTYPDKRAVLAQHAEPGAYVRMRQDAPVFTCRTAFLCDPYGIGLPGCGRACPGSEPSRSC